MRRRQVRAPGPVRVLLAHPSPDLYGSDRMLVESVRSLADAGCAVTVVLPDRGPLVPLLQATGADVVIIETVVLRKAFMSVRGLGTLLLSASRALPLAVRTVRAARADVVYVNTVTIPGWILASRLARTPVVAHVHEAEDSLPRLIGLGLHLPLLLARRVLVNSLAAQQGLTATLPALAGRIRLLYNGVPGPDVETELGLDPAQRTNDDTALRLLLVGRLSPRKGTDVAIAALDSVVRRGVDARLDLVGEVFPGYEWYEQTLREQVSAANLDARVSFIGFQSDVWPAFAASDIVLVPSRVEPFGNVAVEAALARRPVVASGVQGLREIVTGGETGMVVAADDPEAIADAVCDLAKDWPSAQRMAQLAHDDALHRFGTQRYAADLLKLLVDADLVPASA
jgi:glycosyltransferase involved in cell wall biosynthesis